VRAQDGEKLESGWSGRKNWEVGDQEEFFLGGHIL
jgi:hypothetical protein